MKNSKELHKLTRQNEKNMQKSQKHDANLQKNSSLYFQIGLIMCLLAAYGALEMRFQEKFFKLPDTAMTENVEDYMYAPTFKVEPDAVETSEPVRDQPVRPDNPTVVPDDTPDVKVNQDKLVSDIVQPTKPEGKTVINEDDLDPEKPIEPANVPFDKVEIMPIFPGCENANSNAQRKKCMSEKLTKLVQRKFDAGVGSDLGLKEGMQRIIVQFRITKTGDVEVVKTRAPHEKLEKEANRVVDKIPQMKPGIQGGKPVSVIYNLPINFNLQY